jgi:broad-specificity NMP kinase
MIITIEGRDNEGKTTFAKKISEGKKVYIRELDLNSNFCFSEVDEDVEFIIIDDIKNYDKTYSFFKSEKLTINKQHKETIFIKMPHIILITQKNDKMYLHKR